MSNRTATNQPFDQTTINQVWSKAKVDARYGSDQYRIDLCGALIKKADYGNTSSKYGWEIDHNKPVSKGGTDHIDNLQPLQWESNRGKGDNWPNWTCTVRQ